MVLGRAINRLKLDIEVQPKTLPIVGSTIARRYKGDGPNSPLFGLSSYAWGGETLQVDALEVPRNSEDQPLIFIAGENGGFELFENTTEYDKVFSQLTYLNRQILKVCNLPKCFKPSKQFQNSFKGVKAILKNQYEAQIDTGLMMHKLHQVALSLGIQYFGGVEVQKITELTQHAAVHTPSGSFLAFQVVVATNGFATSLLNIQDLQPARAQVLVTKPIPNLHIKGTFHFDKGYYYFRNIDQRILFGGGRNLDLKGETTSQQGLHSAIQQRLKHLLKNKILLNTPFQIDQRWSGIMGVGNEKKPIIRRCSPHVTAAVRMGGMGVAIGSLVGARTVDLIA